MTGRVLVVSNDFPPRVGGIETFTRMLCDSLPADGIVVHTSTTPGSSAVDGALPYPVVRDRSRTLLPAPATSRRVAQTMVSRGCDRVVFAAAAPLALMAPTLREHGARRIVALTHGHEVWWARVPVARRMLRRIGDEVDVLTHISGFTGERVARSLSPAAAERMTRLSPGVDGARFHPGVDGGPWRRRWGIGPEQPVVLAASRLVPRKGFDTLLAAWPTVTGAHPDAVLVIVGDGPDHRRLARRMGRLGSSQARMQPAVAWAEMPAVYAAADVFALPCRTRRLGLEPEGLGIVFLEAAASGLPVVVGRSGGAPETVIEGETGHVVDPESPDAVADRVTRLLDDRTRAREMGRRGREWVMGEYGADVAAATLRRLLE